MGKLFEYFIEKVFTSICGNCPDASVVHASGSGQLQANPHLAGTCFSTGNTRRAVIKMESNDLVVGEVHTLGSSCPRYD